jgi:hypothetical protein
LVLTVLSLAIPLVLVVSGLSADPAGGAIIDTCLKTWFVGFGAVVGLLGGKALSR